MSVQDLLNRLRPLVGNKSGWDYIVLWKLSEDHRCLEFADSICAGTENNIQNNGEEMHSAVPCRDASFSHPRIKSCDLLDHLPSSLGLDSGVHAETLLSNHSSWLSFLSSCGLNASEERFCTRVLVPVSLGLVELFVTEKVDEDQRIMEFIRAQCNIYLQEQAMLNTDPSISLISGIREIAIQNSGFAEGDNKSDESDPANNDQNDGTCRKRTRKGHQSKNLEAERKRRKKLNDRLYSLRALVPKISKLDRGAILGDAINYVKELKELVKDLQIELEEQSVDEHARVTATNSISNTLPVVTGSGTKRGPKHENANDKMQQMEPNVEVFQVDGNEFFVKVFCEHKAGGFLRLMEALDYLGLQVIQVNATRHTCLVSNIFRVKKETSEANFQVDHMKESLLELARNSFSHILPEN